MIIDRLSRLLVLDNNKAVDKCQITLIYFNIHKHMTTEANNTVFLVKYIRTYQIFFVYLKSNQAFLFSMICFFFEIKSKTIC
jgi:hypothetical protein